MGLGERSSLVGRGEGQGEGTGGWWLAASDTERGGVRPAGVVGRTSSGDGGGGP